MTTFVNIHEVLKITKISKSTILRLRKKKQFPNPFQFAKQIYKWKLHEVEAWVTKNTVPKYEKILTITQVVEITGVSQTTIWRLRSQNKFPEPRLWRQGTGKKVWLGSEIVSWMNSLQPPD